MNRIDTTLRTATRTHGRFRLAAATVGLAGALVTVTATATAAEVSTPTPTCAATSATTSWKSAVTNADAALSKALTNLRHGRYAKAAGHLRVMKNQARTANTAATSLIGKPPTDPESDELPGVAAVLRVNGFDHRVTMTLLPLFSSPRGTPRGPGPRSRVDQGRRVSRRHAEDRDRAAPAARDDYVDGLSDGVGAYAQELDAMASALAGTGLTAAGRGAVDHARQIVAATNAEMQPVFGGGERTPPRFR